MMTTSTMPTDSIHGIPLDVMIAAAEHALKENRAGSCKPIHKSNLIFVRKEDGSSLV